MPNIHGQVTREDFRAPEGKFRIMRENMSNGQLSIVADFNYLNFAECALVHFREEYPRDQFTLWNDCGEVPHMTRLADEVHSILMMERGKVWW